MKSSFIAFAAVFFLGSVLAALPVIAAEPRLRNTTLTSGHSMASGKRVPVSVFSQHDYVIQLADFDWEPAGDKAGVRAVEWRWFRGATLVSVTTRSLNFNSTPYSIWTRRAAAALGPGHYRVEALIDGTVVATSEFEITP